MKAKTNSPGSLHQLKTEEVVRLLGADIRNGLSGEEAKRRLEKYGLNRVSVRRGTPGWKRFLLQFRQPLVFILLVASGVTFWLGEYVDGSVIFGVVFINALVGYIQESKAERAIEALAKMVTTEATVRRGGSKQRVSSEELVPGDVVLLMSGDRVPADLRLFDVRSLAVDESMLTGESVPVHKHADPLALDTGMFDRKNLAYSGTLVTYGQAEGLVWATGDRTETGRIAWLVLGAADLSTPLTKKIARFSGQMVYVILGLSAVTFGVGIWHGEGAFEMFMASVALAVGAIPEGLPAAVTVTLAIGVARMAKRGVIIRSLPAVETLGSVTVICTDKTGTLTENQMTVREVYAGGEFFEVTGVGYEAEGEIRRDDGPVEVLAYRALGECLKAGLLCNDTQIVREGDRFIVQGDPTEAALLVAAQKGGLIHMGVTKEHPRVDTIPFESEHQFMATLHEFGGGGERVIYKKGAVERLLDRCTEMMGNDGNVVPLDKEEILGAVDGMAVRGLRVLAFASRRTGREHQRLEHEHVRGGLTFLGLQGMIDPPRPEAIEAISRCHEAGIRVKMITGDHVKTARAIAKQIGLDGGAEPVAVTGSELERLSREELGDVAERASVFARVAPEQKLKLVEALQSRGHVVAMTGDGVNDAPALKQADIGVAMGLGGTDVAKGAADMVLTDDDFSSIEAAVEEGRGIFDNLTKFIVWTLPTNVGEAIILLTAIFLGTTLPALPVQLLWVNLCTAVFLGLFLVFEPRERDLMLRPPRDPRQPILTFPLLMRTGLVCLLLPVCAFGLFVWEQGYHQAGVAEARTIVVNVIVVVELFYLLNCRSLTRSMFAIGVFSNPLLLVGCAMMVAVQVAFTYWPVMNRLFHTAPISAWAWMRIVGVGVMVYLVVGFEKWVRHRFNRRRAE